MYSLFVSVMPSMIDRHHVTRTKDSVQPAAHRVYPVLPGTCPVCPRGRLPKAERNGSPQQGPLSSKFPFPNAVLVVRARILHECDRPFHSILYMIPSLAVPKPSPLHSLSSAEDEASGYQPDAARQQDNKLMFTESCRKRFRRRMWTVSRKSRPIRRLHLT